MIFTAVKLELIETCGYCRGTGKVRWCDMVTRTFRILPPAPPCSNCFGSGRVRRDIEVHHTHNTGEA